MKRVLLLLPWLLAPIAGLLAISFLAPLPIPYNQDFSVLYFADKALLNGISLYDYPTQLEWVRAQTRPDFEFHPYPYPPWYALATLPLALLPVAVAARMWFLLNLWMISASVWLLTPKWRPAYRLFGVLGAVMFIPAFGLLVVGQYTVPVLLGAAIFLGAAQRKSALGLAVALGLLTFKPHIGVFLALAGFGWLVSCRREAFARRAILLTGILALFGAALGLLADARWPLTYLKSLGHYRNIPGVQSCELCASLSVGLVRLATGLPEIGRAAGVSVLLGFGMLGLFYWRFRARLISAPVLMSLAVFFTLLIDPYLLNYDYILLLLPLVTLTGVVQALPKRAMLLGAYLLPWLALVLGRNGNFWLTISTLLVLALFWQDEFPIAGQPKTG